MVEEIFGNPITGYTTEYYSAILDKQYEINENTFNGIFGSRKILNYLGKNFSGKYGLRKHQDRNNVNRESTISEAGLEERIKNRRIKIEKQNAEKNIQNALKITVKSKRWARRQHNDHYTNN